MDSADEKKISLLEEIKIQTKVIMPILNELRVELGKEKADNLTAKALRLFVRNVYLQIGERKSGNPFEKWKKVWDELRPRIGDNVEREFLKNDSSTKDYNVNRCKFAEYFKEINEPELGKILMCDFDYYIAEVGKPVVELTRTQTIMEGADHCDFRYCFNKK
ncbi:MAG: L-2-amino-thiazoline-4-carboxylic acid hydrolase [Spirochaetes bacterium]|nr:L-2-amino-thiazoline-4-carboxylic acid hydrolase [Spirochaetota bacterium]